MALQKTIIDLPFVTGLGLKADERLAPNGAMRQLQNLHFAKDGAALIMREGQQQIADGLDVNGAATYPLVLHERNKELLCRHLTGVSSMVTTGVGGRWSASAAAQQFPDITLEELPSYDANGSTLVFDYATQATGGFSVIAAAGQWIIIENATGAIRQRTNATAGTLAQRCTRIGDVLYILERGGTTLVVKRINNFYDPIIPFETILNVTGLTTVGVQPVNCDMVAASTQDIAIVETNSVTMNVYFVPASGGTYKSRNIDPLPGANNWLQVAIGFDPARNYIFVATSHRYNTAKVEVRTLNALSAGLPSVGGTTTITRPPGAPIRIGMSPVCNPMRLAINWPKFPVQGSGEYNEAFMGVYVYGEGDTTGTSYAQNGHLLGKPFYIAPGDIAVPVAPENGVGGGLQIETASKTIAVAMLGEIPVSPYADFSKQPPPSNYIQPDGSIDFAISHGTGETIGGGAMSAERFKLKLTQSGDTATKRQALTIHDLAIFSGQAPLYYDGALAVNPAVMSTAPEIKLLRHDAGGVMTTGRRQYTVVYEWLDNLGRRYQSPPAIPLSIDNTGLSGNQLPVFKISFPTVTPVPDGLSAVLYSTTDLGVIFYKAASQDISSLVNAGYDNASLYVNVADSTLATNELLYTTGGILDSYGMPPASCMTIHQNRLFVYNPDDRKIWYSLVDNPALAPRFNPLLTLDAGPEEPTALASFDDKLVIFTRTSIYAVFGQGPDNAGNGSNYSFPQLISSDTGCVDARATVLGARGMYFQGIKGFYVLSPGLQVQQAGVDVARLTLGQVYNWAKAIPTKPQIMFGRQTEQLVFDEVMGQWSRFESAAGRLGEIWNDALVMTPNSGALLRQNTGLGYDVSAGSPISVILETGWLKFAAIQGFERLWRMLLIGAYQGISDSTEGTLYVSYRINYDETNTFNLPGVTIPGNPSGYNTKWQLRFHMPHQKIESVKFILGYTCTGASHIFSGMSFEVAGKIGGFKKPHLTPT